MSSLIIQQAIEDILNLPKLVMYAIATCGSNYIILGYISITSFTFVFCFIFVINILIFTAVQKASSN